MIGGNKLAGVLVCVSSLLTSVSCGASPRQEATITLNPEEKFQIITGWEAVAQAGQDASSSFPKYRDNLFDEAVNDLGINRLRLEIRSGVENPTDYFTQRRAGQITDRQFNEKRHEVVNDNEDPNAIEPRGFQFSEIDSVIENVVLPIRALLVKRGESLYVNLNFVDFGGDRGSSNMRHNSNPDEYGEFMLSAFKHIQAKYGFVPDTIEVILEPDNKTGWTGAEIGHAIVATAKQLGAHGFKPKFIVPSTTNAANAPVFIDEIANVPGAMQHISEFSYHRYCCASDAVLERITERASKYGKQTAMLEWIGADYETLHQDLKQANNSAWEQYTLAFPNEPDNGAQYYLVDDPSGGSPVLKAGSRTKFLRQYFHYVRPGSRRIGAETTNNYLDPLAFINADGNYVVVVRAEAPGTIVVKGLRQGTYGVSYATAAESITSVPDITVTANEPLTARIPSAGVITVYGKALVSTGN